MLRKNSVAPQYEASGSETSCTYVNIRSPKSTHLRECWILIDKSQSLSICKCKDNSHLIRKEKMINHIMTYEYLMIQASFDDVWVECK